MNITSLARQFCAFMTIIASTIPGQSAEPTPTLVYFGTSTRGLSQGIYVSKLDLATGKLSAPELAAAAKNPGFLAIHPNKHFLYSVGQISADGGLLAFRINADGKLTYLNEQPTGGAGPTHLTVDRAGKNVLAANYGGGSIACLPLGEDGKLAPLSAFIQHRGSSANASRQSGPHAHGIYTDAANRFVFVPDLGLDKVQIYKFDAAHGALSPNEPPFASVAPGSGPRHFAFTPNGRFAYVINEMLCTMTAFRYNAAQGSLTEVQTISTLPAGVAVQPSYSTAEVFAHPTGQFLYGSNRGHDTIVVYAIDAETGKLTLVEHEPSQVKVPRGFGIDPSGQFLIAGGQDSDNAAVFRIDQKTGALSPTGSSVKVGAPICVVFLNR